MPKRRSKTAVARTKKVAAAASAAMGAASREATQRSRSDASLFVVDTQPMTFAQRARAKRAAAKSSLAADAASDAAPTRAKKKAKALPAAALAVRAATDDLWGSSAAAAVPKADEVKPARYMGMTRPSEKRKRRREKIGKPEDRIVHPAVRIASEGSSYNPEREAHEDALAEALAAEVVLDDEQKRLKREKPKGVPERMPGDSEDESESEDESDGECDTLSAELSQRPHSMRPVTTRERNKRRRHKERAAVLIKKKQKKQTEEQIAQLPNMLGIVKGEARRLAKRKMQREEEARLMKLHNEVAAPVPKAGGKAAPELTRALAMDVLLTGEIPTRLSALTALAGPADLMREQQISLLARGKFEMGGRRSTKQRKAQKKARKALSTNKARWSVKALINDAARAPKLSK
jgi:hypothetical protein